jgi:formylglycine-generating enzyme required for sulfatase activity
MMGSNNILTKIESPFLLGETEVTQELFEKIMGYNPSTFNSPRYSNSNQRPVENITGYDAVMFCNKISKRLGKRPYYNVSQIHYKYPDQKVVIEGATVTINPQANGFRLPYDKEWEYAAKAGTDNQWAGINDINQVKEVAWFKDNSNTNSGNQTQPVKGKQPNEWGFYDMSGNVWEWCYDLDKSNSVPCVSCGGGWYDKASDLRSAYRDIQSPSASYSTLGFRVASSLVK